MISHTKCILSSHPSDMFSHHQETLDIKALSGALESFLVELKCERIKMLNEKIILKAYESEDALSYFKSKIKY